MFSQLKIAARLMVSFGLLNLMIAGLNGYTIVEGQGTKEQISATLRAAKNETKVYMLMENMYKARMAVWGYLATGDETRWAIKREALNEMIADIDDLIETTKDPKRKEQVVTLKQLTDSYAKATERLKDAGGSAALLKEPAIADLIKEMGGYARKIDSDTDVMAKAYSAVAEDRAQKAISDLND